MSERFEEHYEKIIEDDIDWLKENTINCIDREHIIIVLRDSIRRVCNDKPKQ